MESKGDVFCKVWHKTQSVLKILAHWPLENCSLSCNCMQIGFFFVMCWWYAVCIFQTVAFKGVSFLFESEATHIEPLILFLFVAFELLMVQTL
jgi:hypothetical protein